MKHLYLLFILPILCISCTHKNNELNNMIKEWNEREITFPSNNIFINVHGDTIPFDISHYDYKVISYIDSLGCVSCKFKLPYWTAFIDEAEKYAKGNFICLLFVNSNNYEDLKRTMRIEKFMHPICIDEKDSLNTLNHFPTDMNFQTFLLNKENRVVAIGNPILNPQIKELYMNIIQGKETTTENDIAQTEVSVDKATISMGTFDWKQPQQCSFTLTNIGRHPLHITDVTTSCSCTTVTFTHEAVAPGETTELKVTYEAERPEPFLREITIYCNASSSPLQLEILGIAKICEIDRIPR